MMSEICICISQGPSSKFIPLDTKQRAETKRAIKSQEQQILNADAFSNVPEALNIDAGGQTSDMTDSLYNIFSLDI